MSVLNDIFSVRNAMALGCAVAIETMLSLFAGSKPFQEDGWLESFAAILVICVLAFWLGGKAWAWLGAAKTPTGQTPTGQTPTKPGPTDAATEAASKNAEMLEKVSQTIDGTDPGSDR